MRKTLQTFSRMLFLTALLLGVTNAWGANPTVINPATKTFANKTFLDVANTPTNATISSSGTNVLTYSAYYISHTMKPAWYAIKSGTTAQEAGGSYSYSNITNYGFLATASSANGNNGYGYMNVRVTDSYQRYLYITGCTNVAMLYKSASGKTTQVDIEEVSSTGTYSQIGTTAGGTSTSVAILSHASTLDVNRYYRITLKAIGTSSCAIYQIRFTPGSYSSDPAINASNVTINAEATSGEIAYTISNPATGVNPTAVKTFGDWISNVQVNTTSKKVTFNATANTGNTDRTATIKISYTGAEDKTVTITQKKQIVMVTYNKVSASTMVVGGTYVWCAENSKTGYVSSPLGDKTFFNSSSIGSYTAGASSIQFSSDVNIQTFLFDQKGEDTWLIINPDAADNKKYMAVTGSNQTGWKSDDKLYWTLSGTDDPVLSRSDSTLQFNYNSGTNPRFNAYKSNQTKAYLYHLASESAHTLSLNPNYGEVAAVNYLVKDGYSWLPVAPSRSGFEFRGWATTAAGEVAYAPDVAYTMPANASELFAVWTAIAADPEVTPSSTSVNVTSDKYATGTATFSITGRNLSSNLSLELADAVAGLTVNPTSITISSSTLSETTITISYVSEEAVSSSVNLYVKQGEDVLATIAVNYTSTSPITEITDVTGAMTWDFSGYTKTVEFTTTEDKAREVVLGNFVTLTTGDENALKGVQQYIVRSEYCWQGSKLTFHPTVQGVVEIVWSSTSGSNVRTLDVNGTKAIPAGSKKANKSNNPEDNEVSTFNVSANQDVVLTGWDVKTTATSGYDQEGDYYYKSNMIRIWKITFTPAVTVSTAQYATYYHATYSYTMPKDLEGIVVSECTNNSLTLEAMYNEGDVVPAGEPLILRATTELVTAKTFVLYAGTTSEDSYKSADLNLLSGTSKADEWTTGGDKYYRLSQHDGKVGFYWGKAEGAAFQPGANKAYLALNGASAPDRFIFNPSAPITTGVDETLNKYVKSSKTLINGKLYIIRDSKVFDLNGRLVK